ncbi:MAG: xanthine dehydrogenase family protein molybdopterin-binding subunit [Alcaligenaceae bacterium]|nr:MAG: xanthine dehydrogenase family protein molybdopterin-binding subunit [Alcaligenaceae bacterium]
MTTAKDSSQGFPDTARVDAYDKVRGATRYGADQNLPGMAYAMLAVARIGRGTVRSIDRRAALAVPGVRLILTHEDVGGLVSAGFILGGGYSVQSLQPLADSAIGHYGQPIAIVVADTLQGATEAAALVRATYEETQFTVDFTAPGNRALAQADLPLPKPAYADRTRGDTDTSYAAAPVRIEAQYRGPAQHANPIELLGTVAHWQGDALTIYESTQNSGALRNGLARQLAVPPEQLRVVSPSVGGGFGQKNSLQGHTVLVALAARRLGRPVKLVVTREQVFHASGFRPASTHRLQLGADASGRLQAITHEVQQQTSQHDLFPSSCTEISASMYACVNFRGRESLVRTDTHTPGFMRAPWEHFTCFALESAMDELAHALAQDPVTLRLANDTQVDPQSGKPFSSRYLAQCLTRGAERFGWKRRNPAPGSMQAADGTLIGWGVAAGAYKAATAPAIARLRVSDDGHVRIDIGGHEMGQGIRTAVANTVARAMKMHVSQITVALGDTRGVPQHLTAGSWGTATALPAALMAAEQAMAQLANLNTSRRTRTPAQILKAARVPFIEVESRHRAPGQPEQIYARLAQGLPAAAGPHYPEFAAFSYIAHFVEVRVEPHTRRVRVPRVVSVVDCGRVVSLRTARSQVQGGVVWGIGAALREISDVDPRYGGFLNSNLAEYVLPVNLDIGDIEVDFIDEPDLRINAAGVKGLGEVVMTGVAPAIANAIFHATGKRLRDLPIRLENLF